MPRTAPRSTRCSATSTFVEGSVADAALVDRLVAAPDVVVHFAAESHNDNSLDDPWPFVDTNLIGTFTCLEAVRRHDKRLHHISTDEVYGDLELDDPAKFTEGTPVQPPAPTRRPRPAPTCSCAPGSAPSGCARPCRTARTTTARASTSRSSSRARSPTSSRASSPKLYGAGLNVRDWIHVDDHNDAVIAIIEQGDSARPTSSAPTARSTTATSSRMILELMGRPPTGSSTSPTAPGHDLRYAIDASKLRTETDWRPAHPDVRLGPGRHHRLVPRQRGLVAHRQGRRRGEVRAKLGR